MARSMLGFIKDANDGAYFPDSAVRHIEIISNTQVEIHFNGDNATAGSVLLTCTANKSDDVARELARLVAQAQGAVTVADSLNGNFAIADVSAVAAYTINNS